MHRTVLGAVVAAAAYGLYQTGGRGALGGDTRQGGTGEPLAPDGRPVDEATDEAAGTGGRHDDERPQDMPVEAPSGTEATPAVPEIPPPPVH